MRFTVEGVSNDLLGFGYGFLDAFCFFGMMLWWVLVMGSWIHLFLWNDVVVGYSLLQVFFITCTND
jgi:hypothetical protein